MAETRLTPQQLASIGADCLELVGSAPRAEVRVLRHEAREHHAGDSSGRVRDKDQARLVDFGVATRYVSAVSGKHKAEDEGGGQAGTPRFASLASSSSPPARRDDVEALAYVLLCAAADDRLPWDSAQSDEAVLAAKKGAATPTACSPRSRTIWWASPATRGLWGFPRGRARPSLIMRRRTTSACAATCGPSPPLLQNAAAPAPRFLQAAQGARAMDESSRRRGPAQAARPSAARRPTPMDESSSKKRDARRPRRPPPRRRAREGLRRGAAASAAPRHLAPAASPSARAPRKAPARRAPSGLFSRGRCVTS